MTMDEWITRMPKVELHVHLEGSVQPQTLLKLAQKYQVALPASDLHGLREWYTFRDFNHFIEIYMTIARCLRTAEDIEWIAREFLTGQAAQNILYSEVTFTPYSQFILNGLGFQEQIDAVNRARAWAESELGVRMGMIIDIPRQVSVEEGEIVADWVIAGYGNGVIAMGLGGAEIGNPPEKFQSAFERVNKAGIPCILHAGETDGPQSVWSAIQVANTRRIGHGVRSIEDPVLVQYLREKQIPLEVCPTSNLCLKVYPSLEAHSLPQLLSEGLYVTINSDDPPMFNTSLTQEFLTLQKYFQWPRSMIEQLVTNAANVTLLPGKEKAQLVQTIAAQFLAL